MNNKKRKKAVSIRKPWKCSGALVRLQQNYKSRLHITTCRSFLKLSLCYPSPCRFLIGSICCSSLCPREMPTGPRTARAHPLALRRELSQPCRHRRPSLLWKLIPNSAPFPSFPGAPALPEFSLPPYISIDMG